MPELFAPMPGNQPPLKYWAMLCAIQAVLREGDPDIADCLFEEPHDAPAAPTGRRYYTRRQA